MRQIFVVIHRYTGLGIALFLLLSGFTGMVIAFYDELETLMHPEFRLVQQMPDQGKLNSIQLAEMLQPQYPDAMFNRITLHQEEGRSVSFYLQPKPGSGKRELANDEIFVNPYTGQLLAERKWGDISQGSINLLPFLYRLHFSLALEKTGRLILGIVALVWTLDCFVGAYLTFPARQRNTRKQRQISWFKRWWHSWKVRWQGGEAKVNFDLHRAGGLWVWAMLFVFAWSSVAFNLRDVYNPIMQTLFTKQSFGENIPRLPKPLLNPALDKHAALKVGRALMQGVSKEHQFTIHYESKIFYDAGKGTYTYIVNSSRDVGEQSTNTAVMFNANSGEQLAIYLPTGKAAGDTVTQWLMAFHTAKVGGLPMQLFVSMMGFCVVGLTSTGIIIWLKKRNSRKRIRQQKSTNGGST